MSARTELIEKLEKLERETGMSLAMTDQPQYKKNIKEINKLRKQFIKACR